MSFDSTFLEHLRSRDLENFKPDPLIINRVVGQKKAKEIVRMAAISRRNVLLIGPPGIGKSMLGRAYAQLMQTSGSKDVVAFNNDQMPPKPIISIIKRGASEEAMASLNEVSIGTRVKTFMKRYSIYILTMLILLRMILVDTISTNSLLLALLVIVSYESFNTFGRDSNLKFQPKLLIKGEEKPFVDATGQNDTGLFGDVLHDPYQSGNLAIPPHQRLVSGSVHRAHNGVLYIDEIGTLKYQTQINLLSVIQEKELPITGRSEGSSSSVIQSEPIPCNFALVSAGNNETLELLHPALKSRFEGYGYQIKLPSSVLELTDYYLELHQFSYQELFEISPLHKFTIGGLWTLLDISRMITKQVGYISLRFRYLGGIIRKAADKSIELKQDKITSIMVYYAYFLTFSDSTLSELEISDHEIIGWNESEKPGEIIVNLSKLLRKNDFTNRIFHFQDNTLFPKVFDHQFNQVKYLGTSNSSSLSELDEIKNKLCAFYDISQDKIKVNVNPLNSDKFDSTILYLSDILNSIFKENNQNINIFFVFSMDPDGNITSLDFTYKKLRHLSWSISEDDIIFTHNDIDLSRYSFPHPQNILQVDHIDELLEKIELILN